MATITETTLPISALLLDPNNYRFQEDEDFVEAETSRFHEDAVQERAFTRLRREGLTDSRTRSSRTGSSPSNASSYDRTQLIRLARLLERA